MNRYTWVTSVDGTPVDRLVLAGGTIDYGRASVFEQPTPPYAILTLMTKDFWPLMPADLVEFGLGSHSMPSGFTDLYSDTYAGPLSRLTIGAPVTVNVRTEAGFIDTYVDVYSGLDLRRFTGYIVAIDYTWNAIQLTCLPTSESWGRITVGGTDDVTTIPAETDADRVSRLCTEAGVSITIDGTDGPQVIAIPPGTAAKSLTDHLTAIATETGGLLFTDRDGDVHYRTKNWTPPTEYEIPAYCTLRDSLKMSLELGLVRNAITVTYGDSDPQATVVSEDATSIAAYGRREAAYTSMIDLEADAQDYADWIQAGLDAHWQLPDATVAFSVASDVDIAGIAALEQGAPVSLPQLLPGSPVTDYHSTVLGYTEVLSRDDWAITFHLAPSEAPIPGAAA